MLWVIGRKLWEVKPLYYLHYAHKSLKPQNSSFTVEKSSIPLGSIPQEVTKAVQRARFLSGRYRMWNLEKYWSQNKICNCRNGAEKQNIYLSFVKLIKKYLYDLWLSTKNPVLYQLVLGALSIKTEYLLHILLDYSVLPNINWAMQNHWQDIYKELIYLKRTWCFAIHRQKLKVWPMEFSSKWNGTKYFLFFNPL